MLKSILGFRDGQQLITPALDLMKSSVTLLEATSNSSQNFYMLQMATVCSTLLVAKDDEKSYVVKTYEGSVRYSVKVNKNEV